MVLCRSDVVWLLLLVKRLELSNHPEEALPADETTLSDTVKCQIVRYSVCCRISTCQAECESEALQSKPDSKGSNSAAPYPLKQLTSSRTCEEE